MKETPTPIKIHAVELVVERGESYANAARLADVHPGSVWQWVEAHRSGTRTLSMLRATKLAPSSSAALERLRAHVQRLIAGCVTGQRLLAATLPYVLHEDAPTEAMATWLRFYVAEFHDDSGDRKEIR